MPTIQELYLDLVALYKKLEAIDSDLHQIKLFCEQSDETPAAYDRYFKDIFKILNKNRKFLETVESQTYKIIDQILPEYKTDKNLFKLKIDELQCKIFKKRSSIHRTLSILSTTHRSSKNTIEYLANPNLPVMEPGDEKYDGVYADKKFGPLFKNVSILKYLPKNLAESIADKLCQKIANNCASTRDAKFIIGCALENKTSLFWNKLSLYLKPKGVTLFNIPNVPEIKQVGPTCYFTALAMVYAYAHKIPLESVPFYASYLGDPTEPKILSPIAQEPNFSIIRGYMHDSKLAKEFFIRDDMRSADLFKMSHQDAPADFKRITEILHAKGPIVLGYRQKGDESGHAVVITGYITDQKSNTSLLYTDPSFPRRTLLFHENLFKERGSHSAKLICVSEPMLDAEPLVHNPSYDPEWYPGKYVTSYHGKNQPRVVQSASNKDKFTSWIVKTYQDVYKENHYYQTQSESQDTHFFYNYIVKNAQEGDFFVIAHLKEDFPPFVGKYIGEYICQQIQDFSKNLTNKQNRDPIFDLRWKLIAELIIKTIDLLKIDKRSFVAKVIEINNLPTEQLIEKYFDRVLEFYPELKNVPTPIKNLKNTNLNAALAAFFPTTWQDWFDDQKPLANIVADAATDFIFDAKAAAQHASVKTKAFVKGAYTHIPDQSKALVKAITPPKFSVKTYGGGIIQSVCINGQGSMFLSLLGAQVAPETFAKYNKVVGNVAPAIDSFLGDSYSRTAKITGGIGFAATTRATGSYYLAATELHLATAVRALTIPSLAAFGVYKIATYDPITGTTGKDDYPFAVEPLAYSQEAISVFAEPNVQHYRFASQQPMLDKRQDYDAALNRRDVMVMGSGKNMEIQYTPTQAASSFSQDQSDWTANEQFTLDGKKAAYETSVQQELTSHYNFEQRMGMVIQFQKAYKALQGLKDNMVKANSFGGYVPPQAGVSAYKAPEWRADQQIELEVAKQRFERAEQELIADLGHVLGPKEAIIFNPQTKKYQPTKRPAFETILVLHSQDKRWTIQYQKDGTWDCQIKPQLSPVERQQEKELYQQLTIADTLKSAYFKAQQAVEKCYEDGILVVSQGEHDQRVASLKQAEKAYDQHVKNFAPGIVSLTGQSANILVPGSKTQIQGYDHVYTVSCEKVNGLSMIKTDTQRRDFTKPKVEGAVYNPAWGEHMKAMQLAQTQVDVFHKLKAAGKSIENIVAMNSTVLKTVKSFTDASQMVGGLLSGGKKF